MNTHSKTVHDILQRWCTKNVCRVTDIIDANPTPFTWHEPFFQLDQGWGEDRFKLLARQSQATSASTSFRLQTAKMRLLVTEGPSVHVHTSVHHLNEGFLTGPRFLLTLLHDQDLIPSGLIQITKQCMIYHWGILCAEKCLQGYRHVDANPARYPCNEPFFPLGAILKCTNSQTKGNGDGVT